MFYVAKKTCSVFSVNGEIISNVISQENKTKRNRRLFISIIKIGSAMVLSHIHDFLVFFYPKIA